MAAKKKNGYKNPQPPRSKILSKRFTRNFNRITANKGVTQAEAARVLGLSASMVSKLHAGQREPSLYTVEAAAKMLDVDPITLLRD